MYNFLEVMDRCSPSSKSPLNLLPLRQHVPVSPSPVITSTRPKKAPNYTHSTLSDTFCCLSSRCRPLKFSQNLWPDRACSLKSHFSLISPFHLLNVYSHYRTRADLIGREGTAYLGNIFRRSIQNISCLPIMPRRTLLWFGKLNTLLNIFVICCHVKWTSSIIFFALAWSPMCNTLS